MTTETSTSTPPWGLLSSASLVVWDFDGPVCDLFAGNAASGIAERLCTLIGADDCAAAGITGERDPLEVLRRVDATHRRDAPDVIRTVRKRLDEEETEAAETATPTPGAREAMVRLRRGGVRMAVVSNNCEAAVRAYLDRHELSGFFTAGLIGRPEDPSLMKPHPDGLLRVLRASRTRAADAVMIGDSGADARAARAAGVHFIGVHADPGRWQDTDPLDVVHAVPDIESLLHDFVAAQGV
ncbi:HAD-IA family hydrolase [Streptomyces sp. NPDC006283]|uniref:HAD family hydrolase n=1 Tax=Streptomyces sp. NPDC006283 TaxID=3156741 RepID=UPI0033AA495A